METVLKNPSFHVYYSPMGSNGTLYYPRIVTNILWMEETSLINRIEQENINV